MNCSACHTRQIVVGSTEYRVDGGPALVDFQALLADLDAALGAVLASDSAFAAFAAQVLGPGAPPAKVAALRQEVAALASARAHARQPGAAAARLGPRPARRGQHDLQPAGRDGHRPAAELPHPGEYRPGRRSGPLSLPVERAEAGPDAMAGLLQERRRSLRAHPQSRPGLRRVRDLPPEPPGQPCRFPRRQFDTVEESRAYRASRPQDRAAALAVGAGRRPRRPGQEDLRAQDRGRRLRGMPRQAPRRLPLRPAQLDLGDSALRRRHRYRANMPSSRGR